MDRRQARRTPRPSAPTRRALRNLASPPTDPGQGRRRRDHARPCPLGHCTQLLGLNEYQFGLLVTCAALGGLAGPVAFGALQPRIGHAGILRFGFLFEAAIHLLLGSVPPVWVVVAVMVVFGTHSMVWGTAAATLLQQSTPKPLLGRVTSAYAMASTGGSAIGAAAGAIIAESAGLTIGFWVAGAMMVIVAVASWRSVAQINPTPAQVDGVT